MGAATGLPGQVRSEKVLELINSYNIAPRSRGVVIRRDQEANQADQPMLETMQWGLIPHWTKHPPSGPMNTINARSEGLMWVIDLDKADESDPASGGMWHALKGSKRCVVPAQGYYEWQKKGSSKVAHFTRLPLDDKHTNTSPPLIFFAGLWDSVQYLSPVESTFKPSADSDKEAYPTGNPLPLMTYTICTTTPHKDISWLHDRMPCVLSGMEEVERWLDLGEAKGWEEGKGGTGDLLRGVGGLDCYPVPPEVGRIGTNSPTYIQPVSERADGIKSFFQKQAPSPMKPEVKSEEKKASSPTKKRKAKDEPDEKPETATERPIMTVISDDDQEPDLGDDSNAPNPIGKTEKRKFKEEEEPEEEKEGKPKRGGHQTKVVRKQEDNKGKDQPAITNFFATPDKKEPKKPAQFAARGTRSSKRRK